jgi:pimeloyl-ACP methyl ester carboxylesterase
VSTPPFLELPPGVGSRRVPAGQIELAALVATPTAGDERPPVLLVPGFTGSKEDFIAVLAPIAAAGHPVAAVDLRGQFESPGDGDPSSYDLKVLAEDVLAVAHHLGAPVHLVGHSFGGLVARAAALAEPSALRSLTLLSSGPGAIPHPAASNLELISRALPVMDLESIWAAKRQLESEAELSPPPPAVEDFLHRRFVANQPVCLLRMAEQLLAEPDCVDEVAALDLPMLVAFGPDDDVWPPAQQAEMARRLGAGVAVIEGSGHSPAADRPESTAAALLAFWSASTSAP